MKTIIAALVCTLPIIGHSIGNEPSTEVAAVQLSEKHPEETVRTTVGSEFVVRIPVQLGTGYYWQLKRKSKKANLVKEMVASDPRNEPGKVEAQVFRFKALQTTDEVLEFKLSRPFEKNVPASATVRLNLSVRPK